VYEQWVARIQAEGYRLTAARKAVLRALVEARGPLSAAALQVSARGQHSRLGLVTVYRTLEMLEGLGLVRRIHAEGACHGFTASSPGHRHAVTCERCARAVEFDGDDLCELTPGVERKTGYRISGHWLQMVGLCPSCREGRG
jgi:Fe2+ or Zn2+ uptake regulation protein